jgi:hypothetical protein
MKDHAAIAEPVAMAAPVTKSRPRPELRFQQWDKHTFVIGCRNLSSTIDCHDVVSKSWQGLHHLDSHVLFGGCSIGKLLVTTK